MSLEESRYRFHKAICENLLRINEGIPNIADNSHKTSIELSHYLLAKVKCLSPSDSPIPDDTVPTFIALTRDFLQDAFQTISNNTFEKWSVKLSSDQVEENLDPFINSLTSALKNNPKFRTELDAHCLFPDILVISTLYEFEPVKSLVSSKRELPNINGAIYQLPNLHASISCKWTIRSDRSQNTRTEALNLIRNRKGHLPHIVAVTAEPLPTRLAALALGTGDLDCVYHFALPELRQAIEDLDNVDQLDMLNMLVDGRRLRDISDLPFDLAI